jgi:Cellulase (glycosyl hydrolase family 5)
VAVGLVVAAVASAAGVAEARAVRTYSTRGTIPLRTSLFDPFTFAGPQRVTAFGMAEAAGVSYVRLVARWRSTAPANPAADFVASDPTSPGYSWSYLDNTVAAAEDAGLTPILDIGGPPGWALVSPPEGQDGGTPKIPDLEAFATAIATHFDGNHGAPRVKVWQIWNEPNLSLDLSPVKASNYRKMVNAFAGAVHAADPANIVVAGDLDPFANKTKRFHTTAPLKFMRSLLCISMGNPKAKKKKLRRPHATCKQRVQFDVWSHHPYTFAGPFGHAKRPDDVSLGDLPKMRAVLKEAVKLHHIVSSHPAQFWVTEFSWDTNPPRKHAAPVALQARWTAEALYQMWRSGVSLVTWFGFQDQGGHSPYQSGLFFHSKKLEDARAKPMRTSFRFPFVAYLGKHDVSVWGRNATSTKTVVVVQRRHGIHGRWQAVARIRTNRYGIFKAKVRLAATNKDWLRATARGSGKSLAFSLNPPSPKLRYGPWGN